jgi:hypothetical protein
MGVEGVRPAGGRGAVVLAAYLALLFYADGAFLLESQLNYPMWRDMGGRMADADFTATRVEHLWKIFPLLVIPALARLPLSVALLWVRPAFVPRAAVAVALACQAVSWASSVAIQIPIQYALHAGYSDALFGRLIVTDRWLRVLPAAVELAVGGFLLWRLARRAA